MDSTTPIATSVHALELGKVVVEGSDGIRYYADLQSFSSVPCYPQTLEDWRTVHVDSYGLALLWTTRFEVHMDQVVGLAFKKEPIAQTA